MKQLYLSFLLLLLTTALSAQIINIPDANFKNVLLNINIIDTDGDGNVDSTADINGDGEIEVSEAQAVTNLNVQSRYINSLEGIQYFTNLESFSCSNNYITNIDLSASANLKKLRCNNLLGSGNTTINVSQNIALEELYCSGSRFTNLDLTQNTNLKILECFGNQITNLQLSQHPNLERLFCYENLLSTIDVTQCPNLDWFWCYDNSLTNLDVTQNTNLTKLNFSMNQIANIDVTQNINLEKILCANNLLTNLDLTQNTNLIGLNLSQNQITTLDLTQNINLISLHCSDNQIASLNVTQNPALNQLVSYNNLLTNLDLTQNPNLITLGLSQIQISSLDLTQNINLNYLYFYDTQVTTLDLTQNESLISFICQNNPLLESLFIKNGSEISQGLSGFNLSNNPNLRYICTDENGVEIIQGYANFLGYDCVVNSYCSFTPGGTFFEISGQVNWDINANGCSISDPIHPNLNFSITNNNANSGNIIANETGEYNIAVQAGSHTITPILEYPDYYTISPASITVDFPSNVSPHIENFCVTPVGTFNDLEISIIPLEAARPGFDTEYKIIYKNNGNTILSGALNLIFDDNLMNLVSTMPSADSQANGQLTWNYNSILPFEEREIEFTMNLNTPTDTNFPLNSDDILTYNVTINPVTSDETPENNTFILNQTVVNSFDPNDKACLQGNTITPEMVGKYVNYIIRFENTGTANAVNVVVKDDIDISKYDMSSLIPVDGSHSFITRISNTNTVEFIFENINLPYDDATNDGYVIFKVKTLATLVEGDIFKNNAEIYFDYNAPIITNEAETTVAPFLSINEYLVDNTILIYPKPTKDILNINAENYLKTIQIYNIYGQLIQNQNFIDGKRKSQIDLKNLNTGVYIIKVMSSKGSFTDKFIKE